MTVNVASPSAVQTVLGSVDPVDLGRTHMHEHLFIDFVSGLRTSPSDAETTRWNESITLKNYYDVRRHKAWFRENRMLVSLEDAIEEVAHFRDAGGGCIVDLTSIGIGRQPSALRQVSDATGVKIVMGCGYYVRDYHIDELESMTEDDICEAITKEVMYGAEPAGIKAGIIGEIGLSWPVHPKEAAVLAGAAKAQAITGAALNVHPGRSPHAPLDAVRRIDKAGGDLGRVIMSHLDRTLFDLKDLVDLARNGCYLEFDLFGQEESYYDLAPIDMPNDATRVDLLYDLGERGFAPQLLISQDICLKAHLKKYGGEGYDHILQRVVPLMRHKGFSAESIDELLIVNPARALALTAARWPHDEGATGR